MIVSLLFVTIMPPVILYINQKDRPMFFFVGSIQGVHTIFVVCEYEINVHIFIMISGCSGPFVKHWPKDGPWIALIKRGDCTFSQKIKNAESLNASGVLVYDHDSGANLFLKNGKNRI